MLRRAISELDRNLPISDIRTMDNVSDEMLSLKNFVTMLLASFGGLALLLAAIGIYGVMAYSVAQRKQEIGIRIALGAEQRDIVSSVIRQGFALAFTGIAAGVISAFGLTRFLSAQLYGVKPTDPVSFTAVPLVLTAVALLATYVPARRASRVDPMTALRYE
jgi:ABC-type antimicrobial peptide transport system permease subunit